MATTESGSAYGRLLGDPGLLVILVPAELRCEDEGDHATDSVLEAMLSTLYEAEDYRVIAPREEPALYRAGYELALAQLAANRLADARAEDPETYTLSVRVEPGKPRRLVRHLRLVQLSRSRGARPRSAIRRLAYAS